MKSIIARVGLALAALVLGSTAISSAATQDTPTKKVVAQAPAKKHAKSPFSYKGFVRAYNFTRQNASGGVAQVNQQSFNFALDLHGDYKFVGTPFSVGATYFYANPFGSCANAQDHAFGSTCVSNKAPSLNPDDTLPGYTLSTLMETYVKFNNGRFNATLGNQLWATPWANPSDSRVKPAAFQGFDANYAFNKTWSVEGSYMTRFESRTSSAFDNTTLITACVPGTNGIESTSAGAACATNSYPRITNNGFLYGKVAYNGPKGLSASLHYYTFSNLANLTYFEGRYNLPYANKFKPYVMAQYATEKNTGNNIVGKINATGFGLKGGLSLTPNVDFFVAYDTVPSKSDTYTNAQIAATGVTCTAAGASTNGFIKGNGTLPYWLPQGGNPDCTVNAAAGTTTVYYGGFASPYTFSYATDPLFTTSMTQGMADRGMSGSAVKFQLNFTSTDKRFNGILSRAYYNYNNGAGVSPTQETDADAWFYLQKPGKGLLVRYRYGERTQQFTGPFGGLPLFKYNRAQLEYDF
ncbi:MAG: OprD family outer membrane porin [Vulcanimicrobiaceae bacterium]